MFVCITLRYVQRCCVIVGGIVADMGVLRRGAYITRVVHTRIERSKQRAYIVRRCGVSGARGFSDMRAADAPALRKSILHRIARTPTAVNR